MNARLTVTGSAALERRLGDHLSAMGRVAERVVGAGDLRALLLIGGYGRGEGGVDRTGGDERPHNNFDLLLVTRRRSGGSARAIGERLSDALAPMRDEAAIGIDVGAIADRDLERAPCLVMWSDARQGHRVVAGDASFLAGLHRFRPDAIEPYDVERLLANRLTLLVLNRALLESVTFDERVRRAVVRHAYKAIVGVGDAALHACGRYDGSYAEKRRRMRVAPVSEALRAAYEEAIAFRFDPSFDGIPTERDGLAVWNERWLRLAEEVHLARERQRIGDAALGWNGHLARTLVVRARALPSNARDAARRSRNLLACRARIPTSSPLDRALVRTLGWRDILPDLLPLVAYRTDEALAAAALGHQHARRSTLDLAYLTAWGRHGDPNFARVANDLGLALEGRMQA